MKKSLLKEGDVVFLKNGMKVYTMIPERFVYDNAKLSKELTKHEIVVGEEIVNNIKIDKDIKNLANDIVGSFSFRLGYKLSKAEALALIVSKIKIEPKPDTFTLEEGEFVVTKTTHDGGGTAMFNDVYPDGHHVHCKKLEDGNFDADGIEIDFYQTGSFTAMIEPKEISSIRTMSMKFV